MLDIVGSTPGAIKKFLAFAAEVAEVPVLIDSPMIEARVAGLEYAKETGIIDRVVYNSLILQHKQEELQKIKDTGLDSAILLAYDPKAFTTIGRIEAIRELLRVAHKIGINKPLIDTCVLDIPSLGMALRSLFDLKNELGLPTGCGAHNAVSTWRGLKGKMGKEAIKPVIASASAITAAVGADFVMYGPIEDSRYVFPAVAMTNAAFGFLLVEKKERLDRKHPLFRIA
jgi:tetrahydromethanopterin S-methyltransferase subunit H